MYDPTKSMGLDALSPTIAAYKQFVERQNNVNDASVVPFLASRGQPELAGLIAKKMRVENAAKSQQQLAQQPPAAPPTVAQKYDMAAAQQAQQEQMAQGLAGMPNPVMDRANFAGGGIVAFADGGDVQHFATGNPVMALRAANYPGVQPFSPEERESYALSQVGGMAPEPPTDEEIELANRYYRPLFGISSYTPPETKAKAEAAKAKIDAYRAYQKLGGGKSAPLPATPAPAQVSAPAVSLTDSFQTDLARAQGRPSPTDKTGIISPSAPKPTATKPAAPVAPQEDPYAALLGDRPAAFTSTPIDKTPYTDEQKFIENQIKNQGVDEKEARKNFWIMAGASLLGSRDPNFMTALGTAVKENYGNMIQDLRGIKKEHDALALQKIKLDQAMALAQRTQDKEDMARAERRQELYDARVLKVEELKQDAAYKLEDLKTKRSYYASLGESRGAAADTAADRAATARSVAETGKIKAAIAGWQKEIESLGGKYPTLMTPENKAKVDELRRKIDDANNQLAGGRSYLPVASGAASQYSSMSDDEIRQQLGL
jgi:hypothetical protein